MKSAGKARSNGLYRHIRTSKEIIRNLLNDYHKNTKSPSTEHFCPEEGDKLYLFSGKHTVIFVPLPSWLSIRIP